MDEIKQRIEERYENRVEEIKKLLGRESYLSTSPTDLLNAQSKADELEELNERIGIILDSCSNKEIRYLSQKFNKKALGDFYVA